MKQADTVRLHMLLPDEQHRALASLAAESGMSVSQAVRILIARAVRKGKIL
jgi:hypothetical protein